jgi:hypothetical protein
MGLFKFGPAGGVGGGSFDDVEAATSEFMSDATVRIALIEVRHGARIDAMKVVYVKSGQTAFVTAQHGGFGGTLDTLALGENEEVVTFFGSLVRVSDDDNRIGISGLGFITNQGRHVEFGHILAAAERPRFQFESPSRTRIIAFLGRSGRELDSVGVYLQTP